MKRMILFLALVMLIAVSASGCSGAASRAPSMTVEEYSLFPGNTDILQYHLGINGDAVKIKVAGENKAIYTKYELWENGKLVKSEDKFSIPVDNGTEGYVSVSLKDSTTDPNAFTAVLAVNSKRTSGSSRFEIPKYDSNSGIASNGFDGKVTLKEGEEAIIWTLSADKKGSVSMPTDSKIAKDFAPWVLQFKTYLGEIKY